MNCAIYIDADNISYKHANEIITKASNSNVIIKKIYADWSSEQMKNWVVKAKEYGFQGVQCFGNFKKQTSDIYMITDIINDIYNNEFIEMIILATADIDFTHLCHLIKAKNKKLVLFIPHKSSISYLSDDIVITKKKKLKNNHMENHFENHLKNHMENHLKNHMENHLKNHMDNHLKNSFENSVENDMENSVENDMENCLENDMENHYENIVTSTIVQDNLLIYLITAMQNRMTIFISQFKSYLRKIIPKEYNLDFKNMENVLIKYPKHFGMVKKGKKIKIFALFHLLEHSKEELEKYPDKFKEKYKEIFNVYNYKKLINKI